MRPAKRRFPTPPPPRPTGTPFRDVVDAIASMLPVRRGVEVTDDERRLVARALAAATLALVPPVPVSPFAAVDSKKFRQMMNAFTSNAHRLLEIYEGHVPIDAKGVDRDVDSEHKSEFVDLASVSDLGLRDQLRALRRVQFAFIGRPGFSPRFWTVAEPRSTSADDIVRPFAVGDDTRLAWSELPDDGLDSTYRWLLNIDHLGTQLEAEPFVLRELLRDLEVAIGLRRTPRKEKDVNRVLGHARAKARKSAKGRLPYRFRFETFGDALAAADAYDRLNATFPRELRSPPARPAATRAARKRR